ncbi:MAG TPA: BolA/IbaG family iron-sulfur metabolism protein [Pseudohongiella sp.]|nr:BolA/IbaG family iron-sulfur metabolism protein [Pseudohongiella sp.]
MSIDAEGIKALLAQGLPDCDIQVEGGGGKYLVSIKGQVFAGMGPVKRQQLIYQHLNEHISSGAIHAVSMRLQTPEEAGA